MKNNDKFQINEFFSPDVSCAPMYVWVWNDTCTKEIIDAQLNEMQHLGIRAFYILPEPKDFRPDSMPTNLTPDYLTDEFFELSEYAHSLGIKVASMTNSFSIQSLYEKIVNSSIESLNISLNAINNPLIHDESRGRQGSYDKAIEAIQELQRLKKEKNSSLGINIATIMFPENIEEVIPLVEFVTRNKINGIMFQLLDDKESFHGYNSQSGCKTGAYKMPDELRVKYKNMSRRAIEVVDRLIEMKRAGHSIYNSYEQLDAMKIFFNNPDDILNTITCDVGSTNFAIDPYGNVRLCFNMDPVGNIKENLPEEIWLNEKSQKCRLMTKKCKMYCRMLNCNFKHNFANFNRSFISKCINKLSKIFSR